MAIVFGSTLAVTLLLDLTVLVALAVPSLRVWPPPGRETWRYRGTWTLFSFAFVGFLVVGGLDTGSLGLDRWLGDAGTLILGSTLFMGGTAIASYAMGYIGHRAALWFLIAPLAEEPWLETQYGEAYRRYKECHPRFLGVASDVDR